LQVVALPSCRVHVKPRSAEGAIRFFATEPAGGLGHGPTRPTPPLSRPRHLAVSAFPRRLTQSACALERFAGRDLAPTGKSRPCHGLSYTSSSGKHFVNSIGYPSGAEWCPKSVPGRALMGQTKSPRFERPPQPLSDLSLALMHEPSQQVRSHRGTRPSTTPTTIGIS